MKTTTPRFGFRLLLLIVLSFASSTLAAQDSDTEKKKINIDYQIRGGLNISNLAAYADNKLELATTKVGFNVGAVSIFTLSKNATFDIDLMTGIFLTSKGAKIENVSTTEGYFDMTANAMYLQIPAYVGFKANVSSTNNNRIGIFLGPYIAYGVGGKTSLSQRRQSVSLSYDTFDRDGLWNRPDAGLGMELTFELDKMVFILGTEAGMLRAWKSNSLDGDVSVRNRANYISVGYKF